MKQLMMEARRILFDFNTASDVQVWNKRVSRSEMAFLSSTTNFLLTSVDLELHSRRNPSKGIELVHTKNPLKPQKGVHQNPSSTVIAEQERAAVQYLSLRSIVDSSTQEYLIDLTATWFQMSD